MDDVDLLVFDGTSFVPSDDEVSGRVIIDSFPVTFGHVARLDLHVARFARACGRTISLSCVQEAVADVSYGFPRLEFHVDTHMVYLRLRSMPPRRSTTTLWVPQEYDPRERPEIKGWDLDALAVLHAHARAHGCDDALLLDATTRLPKETCYGVLAWWKDDQMCVAPRQWGVLDSVTLQRTMQLVDVTECEVSVEQLAQYPVWVGNALHSWTAVTEIVCSDGRRLAPPTNPDRLAQAREFLLG
ncbi:MAG: aminotransferase class IV [Corynebacterium sp.]|uniref:aminotransferase class IV n=1 Tax=Corynebacterium sp. TaxID=1720 RepID=UPI0026DD39DE|nr:aminotransferase class IV [Corynebacterium sp.]MDO4761354.1 aminotransferase class IV [Corynebacterium sp.]